MQTNLVDMQWSALDFSTDPPAQRTFKVQFEEDEITAEFKDIFDEGRKLSKFYKSTPEIACSKHFFQILITYVVIGDIVPVLEKKIAFFE